jgi:hypothetical protein
MSLSCSPDSLYQGLDRRQVIYPIRIAAWDIVQAWKGFDSETGRDLARAVLEYHVPDISNWQDHESFESAFARRLENLKPDIDPGGRES